MQYIDWTVSDPRYKELLDNHIDKYRESFNKLTKEEVRYLLSNFVLCQILQSGPEIYSTPQLDALMYVLDNYLKE